MIVVYRSHFFFFDISTPVIKFLTNAPYLRNLFLCPFLRGFLDLQQQETAAAAADGVAMDTSEDSVERGMDFRLTTFNLLAPCYKRMHSEVAPVAAIGEAGTGLLANRARTHRTARESEFDDVWRERALETVRTRPRTSATRCAVFLLDRYFTVRRWRILWCVFSSCDLGSPPRREGIAVCRA